MADSPIEKIHIDEFLTLVEGLEVYQSDRQVPPEPDFWAETNLGLIGIEHTRLIAKKDDQNPVAEYRAAIYILNKATENLKMLTDKKVHVKVSFQKANSEKSEFSLQKVNRSDFANDLTNFVLDNFPEHGQRKEIDNFRGKYFHKQVKRISITHHRTLEETHFGLLDANWLKDIFERSNFYDRIKSKNQNPVKYEKKYDQIWLVLVSDRSYSFSDFKFSGEGLPQIVSEFDRVFIYRHGDQKYQELTIVGR